jgi:RNA polymerase sigma-70 factor (ECF subfamily)
VGRKVAEKAIPSFLTRVKWSIFSQRCRPDATAAAVVRQAFRQDSPGTPVSISPKCEDTNVALTAVDRTILQRCLTHQPGAWNDFVDRFLGLIYHVIHHTAHLRSTPVQPEDTEDLAAEVLLQIVVNDYAVLRQFRGQSSLATYLTVIARRICVHELARRSAAREVQPPAKNPAVPNEVEAEESPRARLGLDSLEEVQKLLRRLPGREREVVRLHYLEGRSYEEISTDLNLPVNSIGPILSRARKKLRREVKSPPRVQRKIEPRAEGTP